LKESGRLILGLELDARATRLDELEALPEDRQLVLVVGNEISGVDPGILELCERVVVVPMAGGKQSLNVAVAFGIAVFHVGWLNRKITS
jgi:tRNA G18 (ribose-2'-O)-methylase SpoU